MKNPVLIFGGGVLGKLAIDIFNQNEVLIYGILDDNKELHGKEVSEVTVLGETDDDGFLKLIGQKTEAFVAISHLADRQAIVKMLLEKRKVMPVNGIHPRSYISEEATIGHGNLVAAGVVLNSGAVIGNHCILQSNSVIDPNVEMADFVHVASGAIINSGVQIEEGVFIGSGAIIVSGIKIGKNARIGAGSVVVSDVKEKETVFGNPALSIKK